MITSIIAKSTSTNVVLRVKEITLWQQRFAEGSYLLKVDYEEK